MISHINGFRRAAVVAALSLFGNSTVALAQTPQATQVSQPGQTASAADSRWDAFLGCWSAINPGLLGISPSAPVVCVTPTTTSSAVQIATVRNDSIISRDTVDASGMHRALDKQGCAGWQNAQWSADTRRVYLHTELTCAGGLKRTGNGIFAIAPDGAWLDVQSMLAGANEGVRVNRYRERPATGVPAEIGNPLAGRELLASGQRTAAGGTLAVADIAEAVQHTDTAVTQAWIVERHGQFKLDAKQLLALADAGVPGSVTDVMVGMAYPNHFEFQQQSMGEMNPTGGMTGLASSRALSERDSARIASAYLNERCTDGLDPLWAAPGSFDPCLYGSSLYRPGYGYGYGYGFGYGYDDGYYPYGLYPGYGGYGYYGGFGGGYYGSPVIVVKGSQAAQQHGRVVNGRGYTQGSTGSGTAQPTPSTSSSPRSSGSSGASSSGSSSGGRTAVRRPPV